jgi:hypothetical protein
MKTNTKRIFAIASVLALGLTAVKAQTDSALLDALVKKGVLSDKEADDIRASEVKDYNTTAASKLSIGSYIQKLTFYGDGRLRYDAYSQTNYNYDSKNVTDRFRYRVRIGAEYAYSDNIKTGIELESSTTDDSGNQTMGSMFTKASINVSKIYLQYAPTDWLTADVGKFTNPWYETTDMVYSMDENPEGAAEAFNWTILLGGSSAPVSSDAKDMKAIAAPAPSDSSISIGLTSVQYLYITSAQGTVESGDGIIENNNNVGIIGAQIPVMWKINKDVNFKIVPGFTFYTGGGNTDYQGGVPVNYTNANTPPEPAFVYGTANSGSDPVFVSPREADDLNIVSAPGEFNFKIANVPVKVYEDFDWNVTGKQRVQDVYLQGGAGVPTVTTTSPTAASSLVGLGSATGWGSVPTAPGKTAQTVASQNAALGDNIAWAAGLQVGQNKKKGDWSILAEFRQIGLGSVDPNINGTDFADSYTNVEGVKTSAVYNFTDFLTGTVTFYDTWAYKDNLFNALGGNTTNSGTTAPVAGTTQYLVSEKSLERVQVDLGWKF